MEGNMTIKITSEVVCGFDGGYNEVEIDEDWLSDALGVAQKRRH